MLQSALRTLVLMLGLTGAGAAVVGFQVSLDPPSDHGEFPTETAAQIAAAPTYALDSVVIQRNVFRSDRRPAPARYQPGGQAPPLEPRPPLSVAGVVLGRIRAALLRGLPGVDGVRVLAEGETAAGVRVLRVADTVVVVTWRADTLSLPFPGGGS